MNFLADESVDRLIVEHLRQEGHLVSYIAELGPGMADDAVLHLANQETALLLTADKDFGEMVFRQRLPLLTSWQRSDRITLRCVRGQHTAECKGEKGGSGQPQAATPRAGDDGQRKRRCGGSVVGAQRRCAHTHQAKRQVAPQSRSEKLTTKDTKEHEGNE